MVDVVDIINVGLFAATLRMATPLVYASLGGLFSERAGVVNIALEGMMLTGAFSGVLATYGTGNPWIGVLASILVGGLLGLLHALLTVKFAGNQIVSGTGINLFALGFTAYMSQIVWGSRGASQSVQGLGTISIPLLADIPIAGEIIGKQTPLVYLSLIIVVLSYVVLFKTPGGLRIRAVGEHPAAADTAGVNVYKTKYLCLMVSGMPSWVRRRIPIIGTPKPLRFRNDWRSRFHRSCCDDSRRMDPVWRSAPVFSSALQMLCR